MATAVAMRGANGFGTHREDSLNSEDAQEENQRPLALTIFDPQSLSPAVATFTICPPEAGRVWSSSGGRRAGEDRGWVHANVPNWGGGGRI